MNEYRARSVASRFRLLLAAVALPALATAHLWADSVFDATGFNRNREFFSQLPYEHIDPMTGNVLLTFTDLVLPGNAGFDLKIQRTYNSKIFPNYPGQTSPSEDSWAGVGWSLHLGRILEPTVPFDVPPPIEMPDGSRHPLYHHMAPNSSLCPPNGTGCYTTRDHWVYAKNASPPVLKLPNGVQYTFGAIIDLPSGQHYRYVTLMTDPFGNQITITYMTAPLPPDGIASIVQTVGANTRTVTFGATTDSLRRLSSMTFIATVSGLTRTRTWSYAGSLANGGYSFLTGVTPPTGPGWTYVYNTTTQPFYEMKSVTSPYGGTIAYTYGDQTFKIGSSVSAISRVVKSRITGGTDIATGTWNYAYAQGTGANQTVITSPTFPTYKTTHTFSGIGNFTTIVPWKIGLPTQRKVEEGATTLEIEDLVWRASDPVSIDDEDVGQNHSPDTILPLVDTRTITRGPKIYTTAYTYGSPALQFNDYGRPQTITETGELSRSTTRGYTYGFSPRYIVDKLGSDTVTVAGQAFTKSYGYNLANGFMTTETVYGIAKTFAPDAFGNVGTATDANGHARNYQYTWGQVSRIQTPLYNPQVTRAVNSDATIYTQTRRGFTTSFGYDNLSRRTTTTPPVGNVSTATYDLFDGPSGRRFNRVTRGSSFAEALLDGFGRTSATRDSVGVNTDVNYDARGRRTYESLPYTGTASTGTSFSYDGLDRLKQRTNPGDSTTATYTYSNGIDVTIVNERLKTTVQDGSAFGDPQEARLMRVTDADSRIWTYAYNALGSLTAVTPPTGPGRTWAYYASEAGGKPGLLKSETHPETGTISYTYDGAGLLKTRVDPAFGTTTFTYDLDDRLSLSDRPGTTYDATFNWDASNNRTLLQNSYVNSTFGYDGADRLTSRTDAVNGRTFLTTFTPDGNDNVQQIDYPAASGLSVRYTYDTENRISDVRRTGAPTAWATLFSYHPSGAPSSFTAGNNLVHNFTYTSRHWIDTIKSGVSGCGTNCVVNLNYDYNNGVGNIDSITDTRPSMSQAFTYDNLDRLWMASGVWGAGSFGYSETGNRSTKSIGGSATTYTYDSATQRLASATGAEPDSFSYDTNGNLKTALGATFTYTPENMLETATVGGVATTYRYDGDQTRTLKIQGSQVNYFVHDPKGQILSEFVEPCAGALVPVRDYVYGGTRLLASVRPSTAPPTLTFSATSSSVAEGAGIATLSVVLTTAGPLPCQVTVAFTTANGTAVAGSDYTTSSGMLTFPAGSVNGAVAQINVQIAPDLLDEDDNETFTVSLFNPTGGASLGAAIVQTVTIVDDDPQPSLSINDVSVTEGGSGTVDAVFTVSLSAPSGRLVTVNYATASGTATSGADFLPASGTLSFAVGATTRTIPVPVVGEAIDEDDETYVVNLSTPTNATIADGQGQGTIVDDDLPPTISIANCALVEGDLAGERPITCAFHISLSAPSSRTITVDHATADNTAIAGTDYYASSGTLTFIPGLSAQDVTESTVINDQSGPNRTYFVNLTNATNATIGQGQAVGTITDNDLMKLFTLAPCRLADTAGAVGPSGGPALSANTIRNFPGAGLCGIPLTAKAIAAIVTTVQQTEFGDLRVYYADGAPPLSSTINYMTNHARSNNAIVALGTDGRVAVMCDMLTGSTGTVRFILDVFGYFE